jgi:hypothetical protein
VSERVIVLQQQLRTVALAGLLAAFLVVFVAVSFALAAGKGLSATFYVVETIGVLTLAFGLFLFLRIVVRVVVTSTSRTLEVLYGPGGFVRQVFGPEKLVSVSAGSFSFVQMGGWGYRGSLRLFRRAALATRHGDALDVRLVGGRRFIVTVDRPEEFVAALESREFLED